VLAEGVTLEIGARGLRGLFSSKPSEKDIQRVKQTGGFTVRTLRAVLASDGSLDAEEKRSLDAFIGALGLPAADTEAWQSEEVKSVAQMEVYGAADTALNRALIRSAWLAAAWDTLDPREEEVVRTLGSKLGMPAPELETHRTEALARVDGRRALGLAAVDAVRFVLSDRVPGYGAQLAVAVGNLTLPRRYRDEALANIGHWTAVQLTGRHRDLSGAEKTRVLSLSWLACLFEDPTVSRRALLRARHDRVAVDLGEDGKRVRQELEQWLSDVLAPAAFPMVGDAK
jgi:tellurite resistance protein